MDKTTNPPRKYKFLRRNIVLDHNRDRVLAKVRSKKVYLREVNDQAFHLNKLRTLDHKRLGCLTSLKLYCQFTPMRQLYCLNIIKSAINLRKFSWIAVMSAKVQNSLCYFYRMSKTIESIELDGSELTVELPHIIGLYRALCSKINLKSFRRAFEYYDENQGAVLKEYSLINRYISRFRKPLEFYYEQSDLNQKSFHKILKQAQPWQCVTDLSIVIDAQRLGHLDGIGRILHIDGSEVTSQLMDTESETSVLFVGDELAKIKNNAQDSNFDSISASEDSRAPSKDDIAPFFRFELFPNLKKLQIMLAESYRCSLGPFVVEGFSHLKKLEQITITLENRPSGVKYLFEGLLCLPPLLTSFSLEIPFIRQEESDQLAQFFKVQTQLISLSLILRRQGNTRARSENLSDCLMNVWQYLEDKPNLRYLRLNSIYTPIENLSYGLKRAPMVHQLKEFEIQACDNFVNSQLSPSGRVEGLCDFLLNQRQTLHRLKIVLNYVIDADMLNNIGKAISALKELTELEICVNSLDDDLEEEMSESEATTHDEDNQLQSLHFDEAYLQLRRTLQGLPKLCNLILDINPMSKAEEAFINESLKIFNILPTIKTLKTVRLRLPFDKTNEAAKASIAMALSELKNVTSVDVRTSCEPKNVVIQKAVNDINNRQAVRCDLMF